MSPPAVTSKPGTERRFVEGARFTQEFHMGKSRVHDALEALATRLDALEIPYAIVGAMALNAYGYLRATVDIDVLLTREGLERLRGAVLGRGYVEKLQGSRGFRDAARGVDIDVVLAGDYPGDGREKPVELIRVNRMPADYRERLNPYVRDRFTELWRAAQASERE